MKFFGAVIISVLAVVPLSAQYWSVGGFGSVVNPGLGHAPAGGTGWGNVVSPAIPRGAASLSGATAGNHFGTLVPGFRTGNGTGHGSGEGHHRGGVPGIYAYPVYIGGYGYTNAPQEQAQSSDAGDQPAQRPIVINQYFNTPPPDQAAPADTAASNYQYFQAPANNDAAPPSDTNYYLIAFKDHTVYSAVAYYTDGDTLHYFTAGNTHNQVSLSLVDRQLTDQLNRAHGVSVRLP